jgi:hypothetical protein
MILKKWENVDILDIMRKVAEVNTFHHLENDLSIDIKFMTKAASNDDPDLNYLFWRSRTSGTECGYVRDAYIKDTAAYSRAVKMGDYESMLHLIKIKGLSDKRVIGDIYRVSLQSFREYLEDAAFELSRQMALYKDGHTKEFSKDATVDQWDNNSELILITALPSLENMEKREDRFHEKMEEIFN